MGDAGFCGVQPIRFAFLIVVLPPFVWDSLTYHLTNVAHWTQTGRIELFEAPVIRIYTPANYETLATWFTVFMHHDLVVEAAGLPAYGLALLAVYALARELGASRTASWLASLTYASTPALLLATTGTKNDPHMAAYFLTCLAIIAGLLNRDPDADGDNPLAHCSCWVWWCCMLLGPRPTCSILSGLACFRPAGGAVAGRFVGLVAEASFCLGQAPVPGMGSRIFLWSSSPPACSSAAIGMCGIGSSPGTLSILMGWPLGVPACFPKATGPRGLNLDRLEGNLQSLVSKFGDPISPSHRICQTQPDGAGLPTAWGSRLCCGGLFAVGMLAG